MSGIQAKLTGPLLAESAELAEAEYQSVLEDWFWSHTDARLEKLRVLLAVSPALINLRGRRNGRTLLSSVCEKKQQLPV